MEVDDLHQIPHHMFKDLKKRFDQGQPLREFKEKIVLVGFESTLDKRTVSDTGDAIFGVEIHASAISNLLESVHIVPLSPLSNFVVILLMSLCAVAMRVWLGRWGHYKLSLKRVLRDVPVLPPFIKEAEVPVALFVAVLLYFFCTFLAYRDYRLVFDFSYHISALLLAYWSAGMIVRKTASLPEDKDSGKEAGSVPLPSEESQQIEA